MDRELIRAAALKVISTIEGFPSFKGKGWARQDWLAPPPLSSFSHLEPLGFGVIDDDGWWCFNPEECVPEIQWPLNVGIASLGETPSDLQCVKITTVVPRQVRGYADRFSPYMVRHDHAQVIDGLMVRCASIHAFLGGRWVEASKRTIWEEGTIPTKSWAGADGDAAVRVGTAVALRQRYTWGVSLGLEDAPSVRFETDPTGIKDAFRIRDLPDGKDRRAALMTWVSDHWRQRRADPEIEIYVRKHLRGATKFGWKGMNAEILPSQFDVEQRDAFIVKRDRMRSSGEDRRVRA